jgi:hypothetical protein
MRRSLNFEQLMSTACAMREQQLGIRVALRVRGDETHQHARGAAQNRTEAATLGVAKVVELPQRPELRRAPQPRAHSQRLLIQLLKLIHHEQHKVGSASMP